MDVFGFPAPYLELMDFASVLAYRHLVVLDSLADLDVLEV